MAPLGVTTGAMKTVSLWQDFLPGSSDIDWCETNYVISNYIAEYYNTVSNVIYVTMPPLLIYLFHPYSKHMGPGINVVWLLLMVVGLGSIYFHATLSFAGQMIDELAIVWVLLAAFAIWTPKHLLNWPFNGNRRKYGQFLVLLGLLVMVLALVKPILNAFILITVSIPVAVLLIIEMKACKDRRAWKLCYISLLWVAVSLIIWFSDRLNCSYWLSINFPYLHSLWHVSIFLGAYIGCVLWAYLHTVQERPSLKPEIRYWPTDGFEHGVPYVHLDYSLTRYNL